ncbi:MAG: SDR family NAD(P)-dependent oxidoreductase [bacterium]|nr:SDR family NAD(P)-dependent oxidoreductase [bacterium]
MRLAGNSILITGGGTGIGLGLAGLLLASGNEVTVCGRRQDKLDEARALHPGLRAFRCDVSDAEQRRGLLDFVADTGPAINVLINNAASMRPYDFTQPQGLDMAGARQDVTTNFLAPIEMTRLFLPMLLESEHPCVINVSSPGGVVPVARFPFYCASKAALDSLTRSLRHQFQGRLEVVTIYPPSVETEMMQGVDLRTVSVEDCCEQILRQLPKGKDEVWIGEGRYVPFLLRLAPRRLFDLVNRATRTS